VEEKLHKNEADAKNEWKLGFDGGKEAQVACRGPDCSLNGQG